MVCCSRDAANEEIWVTDTFGWPTGPAGEIESIGAIGPSSPLRRLPMRCQRHIPQIYAAVHWLLRAVATNPD